MSNQRTAVITGASSGFGLLTAQAFAADGWRVYATMRDTTGRNAGVAGGLRRAGITVVELDVTSDVSVDAAAKAILNDAGQIDVLVNNAGIAYFGVQEAYSPAFVERQYATNVVGPLRVNRAFLPSMRERKRGLIVYVTSVVGRIVFPYSSIYSSSKWALEALAEASSYELAPFRIDVAIVQPGAFPTEIIGKTSSPDDSARSEAYNIAQDPVDRVVASAAGRDPSDVAKAILRLANAPAGTRPLRTVVPENPAVEAINAAVAPIQRQVIEGSGLEHLLSKTPA